jgi:hypothetical protein
VRKSTYLIAGIALGVFISKQIDSNPETKKTLQDAAGKVKSLQTQSALDTESKKPRQQLQRSLQLEQLRSQQPQLNVRGRD